MLAARVWPWLLIATAPVMATATACASREPFPPPGRSTVPLAADSAPSMAAPPAAADELRAAIAWPELGPRVRSLGHGPERRWVQVRVSPGHLEAVRALTVDGRVPEGGALVAVHSDEAGTLLDVYRLEKREGAWRPSALDAAARPLELDADRCVGCHSSAPADYVFDVTRRAETPAKSASSKRPANSSEE